MKKVIFLLMLPFILFAKLYDVKVLEKKANNGSKQAMYKLGYIYEHGLGVPVNYKKSTYWYKRISNNYSYTIDNQNRTDINTTSSSNDFIGNIEQQMSPVSNKKGASYALHKLDTNTPETKKLIDSLWKGNFFGLTPYHENYFLPLSIAKHRYPRHYETLSPNASSLTPIQEKYKNHTNTETEFQISFKKQLSYNFFGFHEFLIVAYTQTVWWQLYEKSSPFREMNYKPEIFLIHPSSEDIDEKYGLKGIKYGFLHDSNGQDGYHSRAWNRLHVTALWQWGNLFMATRIWYRIPEKRKSNNYYYGNGYKSDGTKTDPNENGDDNPDIIHYMGYGDIHLNYLIGNHQITVMGRYNFGEGGSQRGAIKVNWTYPFFHSKNVFWYAKVFNGYGESLIDYNRCVTKASLGFSFSRRLF